MSQNIMTCLLETTDDENRAEGKAKTFSKLMSFVPFFSLQQLDFEDKNCVHTH